MNSNFLAVGQPRLIRFLLPTLLCTTTVLPLGCKEATSPAVQKVSEAVVSAATITAEPVAWPTFVRCQGSLFADETTTVSSRVAGRVRTVHFEIGDLALPGQVLVEIDSEEYRLQAEQSDAQLAQARAAVGLKPGDSLEALNPNNAPPVREAQAVLDEATKAMARVNELAGSAIITATDRELAIAAERVAEARLASAQNGVREKIAQIRVQMALSGLAHQRVEDTRVLAPFEGFVQNKSIAVGTYVQAGQPLLTLVRNQKLRFRSSVPEKNAHQLRIGQKVSLRFDLSGQQRQGIIARINPNLDPVSRSLGFEVDIDNADQSLRSGLFAEAIVEVNSEAQAIVMPAHTVRRFAGVDKVWKVVEGQVREHVVRLGASRNDLVEIVAGVEPGDILIERSELGRVGRWAPPQNEGSVETAKAPIDLPKQTSEI